MLHALDMWRPPGTALPSDRPQVFRKRAGVQAEDGGLLPYRIALGHQVRAGGPVGVVSSPISGGERKIPALRGGAVIGLATLPLVHPGDVVCHLAW